MNLNTTTTTSSLDDTTHPSTTTQQQQQNLDTSFQTTTSTIASIEHADDIAAVTQTIPCQLFSDADLNRIDCHISYHHHSPSLTDEDEDEEEIISLERSHRFITTNEYISDADAAPYHRDGSCIRHAPKPTSSKTTTVDDNPNHHHVANDLRRTPGANVMHRSVVVEQRSTILRRTPGAVVVPPPPPPAERLPENSTTSHRRRGRGGGMVVDTTVGTTGGRAGGGGNGGSFLGFGLMLSTPVGVDRNKPHRHRGRLTDDDGDGDGAPDEEGGREGDNRLPPRLSNGRGGNTTSRGYGSAASGGIYTPSSMTLSRNPHLNVGRGVFSPNTILLTESLDNLLHDDEEEETKREEDNGRTRQQRQEASQRVERRQSETMLRQTQTTQQQQQQSRSSRGGTLQSRSLSPIKNNHHHHHHQNVSPASTNGGQSSFIRIFPSSSSQSTDRSTSPKNTNNTPPRSQRRPYETSSSSQTPTTAPMTPGGTVNRSGGGAFAPPVKLTQRGGHATNHMVSPARHHHHHHPATGSYIEEGSSMGGEQQRVYPSSSAAAGAAVGGYHYQHPYHHQGMHYQHPLPPPAAPAAPTMMPHYYYPTEQQQGGGQSWSPHLSSGDASHMAPLPHHPVHHHARGEDQWNPHYYDSYYHPHHHPPHHHHHHHVAPAMPPEALSWAGSAEGYASAPPPLTHDYYNDHSYPPPPMAPPSLPFSTPPVPQQPQQPIMGPLPKSKPSKQRPTSRRNPHHKSPPRTTHPSPPPSSKKSNSPKRHKTPKKPKKPLTPPPPPSHQPPASPSTRTAYKDFLSHYRHLLLQNPTLAAIHAQNSLRDASLHPIHWKIYLELADNAKRNNDMGLARSCFLKATALKPAAPQTWLDYAKLEDEMGETERAMGILERGWECCFSSSGDDGCYPPGSDALSIRCLKQYEKLNDRTGARRLLGRCCRSASVDKVWRIALEGALMESRAGNVSLSRKILLYLLKEVPWYGPLYGELYRLERDDGRPHAAMRVVERGLSEIPRYGPLWFGAFRLGEGLDLHEGGGGDDRRRTWMLMERARECISRELLWKVYLEMALLTERTSGDATKSRRYFTLTLLTCPTNLTWKVYLAAARAELLREDDDDDAAALARRLFLHAYATVPEKGRPTVLLECSRMEEFLLSPHVSRAILAKARKETPNEWKVWLESVLLEWRWGRVDVAVGLVRRSLVVHGGTGRLWASLVQLRQGWGEREQGRDLRRALRSVPKSGEVWCEGARLHLNPFTPTFDLEKAKQHLQFATQFTPQYGDSFLESLRLELLLVVVKPIADTFIEGLERMVNDYYEERRGVDGKTTLASARDDNCNHDDKDTPTSRLYRKIVRFAFTSGLSLPSPTSSSSSLYHPETLATVDTTDLERRCANADPNYGLLWFHCRHRPTDIARIILFRAKRSIAETISKYVSLYVAAMVRRVGIVMVLRREWEGGSTGDDDDDDGGMDGEGLSEEIIDERLRSAPSLKEMLDAQCRKTEDDERLKELRGLSGADFVTGLTELNGHRPLAEMSLWERRKVLFGSDSLLS